MDDITLTSDDGGSSMVAPLQARVSDRVPQFAELLSLALDSPVLAPFRVCYDPAKVVG